MGFYQNDFASVSANRRNNQTHQNGAEESLVKHCPFCKLKSISIQTIANGLNTFQDIIQFPQAQIGSF